MAFDLLDIRMRLSGAQTTNAQLNETASSMERVGAAATTAGEEAAAGSAGISKFATAGQAGIASMAAGMGRASKTVSGAGTTMMATGKKLSTKFSLPVAAIGAVAIKSASDFHAAMQLINTQAGASQHEVDQLSGKVLDLAKVSPQGPTDLANALYRLEGAGLHGAKAMDALKASSQLATVGMADVEDTAKTLAQTWFVGMKGTGNFRNVVAELNATVGAGDLRLQQLVDALGTGILPAAKQAGLHLSDVTGALAVFGDETNNVSGFAAQLATALHYLTNPTDKAKESLDQLGLSQAGFVKDLQQPGGLLKALTQLHDALDKMPGGLHGPAAQQAIGNILPGGRGRVLLVLMNQLDRYQQKLDQIADTHDKFGQSVEKSMDQPLNRLKTAWSSIQVALIQVGDLLIPVVVPALITLANTVGGVASALSKLPAPLQHVVVGFMLLAAVVGPLIWIGGGLAKFFIAPVISGLGTLIGVLSGANLAFDGTTLAIGTSTGAVAAFDIAVLAIPLAIAAVVAGLVILYMKVKWFRDTVNTVFNFFKDHPLALILLGPVGQFILAAGFIITHLKDIKTVAGNVWGWIKNAAINTAHAVVAAFKWWITAIRNVHNYLRDHTPLGPVEDAISWIIQHAPGAFHAITSAAQAVWGWMKSHTILGPLITGFKWLLNQGLKVFPTVWRTAWSTAKTAVNAVWSVLKKIVNGMKWVMDQAPDFHLPDTGGGGGIGGFLSGLGNDIIPGGGISGAVSHGIGGHTGGVIDRTGVVHRASGGPIPGWGNTDKVPTLTTPAEWVIRRKSSQHYGYEAMSAINEGKAGIVIPPRSGHPEVHPVSDMASIDPTPRAVIAKVFLDRRQIAEAVADETEMRKARK